MNWRRFFEALWGWERWAVAGLAGWVVVVIGCAAGMIYWRAGGL